MSGPPRLLRRTNTPPLTLSCTVEYAPSAAEPPYVTDIVSFRDAYIASASDSSVQLLDKRTLRSLGRAVLSTPDADRLTGISKVSLNGQELLLSVHADGRAVLRDPRTSGEAAVFKGPDAAPCLSCSSSVDGPYLATGTELFHHEASIRIHDLRKPGKPMHIYADTHSDDVSTLAFHPEDPQTLLSGSVDGLISTIDVRLADEDDAILYTANVGASLAKVGWTSLPGKRLGGVFALTNMETLSMYDALDELSIIREFGDLREAKCELWETHYVIDCVESGDGLVISAGTREGGIAVLRAPFDSDWTLEQLLTGRGHSDIVRATVLDFEAGSTVSCGEDGRIALWRTSESTSISEVSSSTSLKAQRDGTNKSSRFAPY